MPAVAGGGRWFAARSKGTVDAPALPARSKKRLRGPGEIGENAMVCWLRWQKSRDKPPAPEISFSSGRFAVFYVALI